MENGFERRQHRPEERYEDPIGKENEVKMKRYRELFQAGLSQGDRIERSREVLDFIAELKEKYADNIRQDRKFLTHFTLFNLINRSGGVGNERDLPDGEIAAFLEQFGVEEVAG